MLSKRNVPVAQNPNIRGFHTSIILKNQNDNTHNSRSNNFRRILTLAKPEATKLTGAVGLLAISSGVTLSVPFCMGRLIDLIQEASQQGTMDGTLQQMALGLSAIFIVGGIANAGRVYLLQSAGVRIMQRLRERVYSSIISQEIAFFDKSKTGELINRLAADTEIVSNSVTQNLSDGLRSLAQVSAGIGMMFYMSPQLASVVLMVVPPVAVIGVLYGRFVRQITRKTQTALANSTQTAEEKISNIRTVRAFGQENAEMDMYSRMVLEVQKYGQKEAIARGVFYGFLGFSGNMVMLLVLYNGGVMMHSSVITVGNLSAFLLYSGYVGIAITGLSKFYSELNRSFGASERLWELADRIPTIPISGGEIPHSVLLQKDITFQNVFFSYPMRSEKAIFDNLNLTIKAGSLTAVVGSSGSGKSTIASLLLRFYEPSAGHIKIGHMDLNTIDPQWVRKNIGTVSQEPVLFSGTIRENILYGSPASIDEVDLVDAAKKSNSLEFIESLPDKFETLVGERGITLSGGQRQRVAIARALLKNPKILLLDEATSALDAESEHLVQEALERLMVGRTTLTIAHRLSTIKNADKIAVLGFTDEMNDEGTYVVEEGSYHDLMALEGGAFRKLVERQTMHDTQT